MRNLQPKKLWKVRFYYNITFLTGGIIAHFGVKVPYNGSKHLNLLNTTSNSKSRTSKTLVRKILLIK